MNAAKLELREIQHHMPVVGPDARNVGVADRVDGDCTKLAKSDPQSDREERRCLPLSTVAELDGGREKPGTASPCNSSSTRNASANTWTSSARMAGMSARWTRSRASASSSPSADDPDGSGAHHHYLSLGAVASVSGDQVQLNLPAEQAKGAALGGAGGGGSAQAPGTGGLDKGMGAQAGVTGAGSMVAGNPGTGNLGMRDGVADLGPEAGPAGMSGDRAPGTISGRDSGGTSTGGRNSRG